MCVSIQIRKVETFSRDLCLNHFLRQHLGKAFGLPETTSGRNGSFIHEMDFLVGRHSNNIFYESVNFNRWNFMCKPLILIIEFKSTKISHYVSLFMPTRKIVKNIFTQHDPNTQTNYLCTDESVHDYVGIREKIVKW